MTTKTWEQNFDNVFSIIPRISLLFPIFENWMFFQNLKWCPRAKLNDYSRKYRWTERHWNLVRRISSTSVKKNCLSFNIWEKGLQIMFPKTMKMYTFLRFLENPPISRVGDRFEKRNWMNEESKALRCFCALGFGGGDWNCTKKLLSLENVRSMSIVADLEIMKYIFIETSIKDVRVSVVYLKCIQLARKNAKTELKSVWDCRKRSWSS